MSIGEHFEKIQRIIDSNNSIRGEKKVLFESFQKKHNSLIDAVSRQAAKILVAQKKADLEKEKADLEKKETEWLRLLLLDLKALAQSLPA